MSLNWVMLSSPTEFIRLPSEQVLYKSPVRTSLALRNHKTYPGCDPFSVTCSGGHIYLTNRRVVYLPVSSSSSPSLLPDNQTPFQSFAAPLTNLHDSHVTAPWLGPNAWVALVQPVPNGGIPASQTALELKLTFKEGGAYDFHESFVRLRERLAQAREVAAASNAHSVDANVCLEDLPAYEEYNSQQQNGQGNGGHPGRGTASNSRPPQQNPVPVPATAQVSQSAAANTTNVVPDEPPPGYEEAQMAGVASSAEAVLRRRVHMGESEA